MRDDGKNAYIPTVSKNSNSIEKQIEVVSKIDRSLEDRYQSKVVVLCGKEIDAFTLMLLADYHPKLYWVDSKKEFDKVKECSQNFDDYSHMDTYLRMAEDSYWIAFDRIKKLSGEHVFRDEYIENIFHRNCWKIKANAESATRVWIKNQLKAGVVNRLDLQN